MRVSLEDVYKSKVVDINVIHKALEMMLAYQRHMLVAHNLRLSKPEEETIKKFATWLGYRVVQDPLTRLFKLKVGLEEY